MARVGVEQALLIGQDDQRIGLEQVGHQGAKGIVVAKADLVGDHGVVFIDHRHHLEVHQRAQRRARVEVTLAIGQIVVGQQNLRGHQAMAPEVILVGFGQHVLPHRRSGLELSHR